MIRRTPARLLVPLLRTEVVCTATEIAALPAP